VQNGMRTKFFFKDLKKFKNLEIDYMLTFNDPYSKEFATAIKGSFVTIGSFLSNKIALSKNKKKTNFVNYISSGPGKLDFMKVYKNRMVSSRKYFYPEKICLNLIKNYCLKNNLKLNILGRSNTLETTNVEKKFFKKILGDFNFKYIKFKSSNRKKTYNLCDRARINFCIYSALGLEILSRYAKVFVFNYREKVTNYSSLSIFWPLKISKDGRFWTSERINKDITKKFNNINRMSQKDWIKYLNKTFSKLIKFDPKNEIFQKKIKELLNA
jgi:surface carbohydrate biosynthesis protein